MKIKFTKGDPRHGLSADLDADVAQRLIDAGSAVADGGEAKAVIAAPENKAERAAPENKAITTTATAKKSAKKGAKR